MFDPVQAIIRSTLLHETIFDKIEVALAFGQVKFFLLQPDEHSSWPDHELVWTFHDVSDFQFDLIDPSIPLGETLLAMDCLVMNERYRLKVSIGQPDSPRWILQMTFVDLRYQRA